MDIDPELISYLITIILGVIATYFGDKWVKAKALATKFSVAIRELTIAIEDDRITQQEAERIVESWSDVINEANSFFNTTKKTIQLSNKKQLDSIEKKVDLILAKSK